MNLEHMVRSYRHDYIISIVRWMCRTWPNHVSISLYLCICMCVSVWLDVSICPCVYVHAVCQSVRRVCICLSVCVYVFVGLGVSLCPVYHNHLKWYVNVKHVCSNKGACWLNLLYTWSAHFGGQKQHKEIENSWNGMSTHLYLNISFWDSPGMAGVRSTTAFSSHFHDLIWNTC